MALTTWMVIWLPEGLSKLVPKIFVSNCLSLTNVSLYTKVL